MEGPSSDEAPSTGAVSSAAGGDPQLKPPPEALTFHRYYHVFYESEFRGLMLKVEGIRLDSITFDCNNWVAEFTKLGGIDYE